MFEFNFGSTLLTVYIVNILLYVVFFGGIYFSQGLALNLMQILLPFVLLGASLFLFKFKGDQTFKLVFGLLVLIAIVFRVMTIFASPKPAIDTFDLFQQGPRYLLEGKNPYEQYYPERYQGVVPNYYSYSPLTLLLFLPSVLVFGDPRVTYIALDVLVVYLFYKMLQRARGEQGAKYLLPLLFLYHPSRIFIFEQAWMDPAIYFALVLFVFQNMHDKFKSFSFLSLAFFFGLRHTMFFLMPLFFVFRKLSRMQVLASAIFAAMVFAIFYFWSPSAFWEDMVAFYLKYPVRYDSLTLNTFLYRNFSINLPAIVMTIAPVTFLILTLVKKIESWRSFILTIAFVLFAFSFFNKLAFINHYFLISNIILLAVVVSLVEKKEKS